MIKDHVKCCNCDFVGLIDVGKEICPKCGHKGGLAWVNPDEPEVNELTPDQRLEGMAGEFLDKENMKEITGQANEQAVCPSEDGLRMEALCSELVEALKEMRKQIFAHHKMDVKKDYSLLLADAMAGKIIDKAESREVDPTITTMLEEYRKKQAGELISIDWHLEDVIDQAKRCDISITTAEAKTLLEDLKFNHNPDCGISWDTINDYLYDLEEEREAKLLIFKIMDIFNTI